MRFRLLLPCLTCAFFLMTCSDSSDAPSGVGGPLEIAGGGCKDGDTNDAINALGSTGSPKGKALSDLKKIFQVHCVNVETFRKNGQPTEAGLEAFRAMASIIVNKDAPITTSQAIGLEMEFCDLSEIPECPPWEDVPVSEFESRGETFYDGVAVGLASDPDPLNVFTPPADLDGHDDGDDNFSVFVQINQDKTVAGAITILEIASSFEGECHFGENSEFVCAGGIFNLVLFPEDGVNFAGEESSEALGLAQFGSESRVGVCEGVSDDDLVLTEHIDEDTGVADVSELPLADLPPNLVCDEMLGLRPSGLRGLAWDARRLFTVTPAWAGRGGAMFANSDYGGGAGERFCTISGHVDTTFDNNAEGVIVSVTGPLSSAADTTDPDGNYGPLQLLCPTEAQLEGGIVSGGDTFTIKAEKQPGHPAFNEMRDEMLPTVVAGAEVTADTFNFLLMP